MKQSTKDFLICASLTIGFLTFSIIDSRTNRKKETCYYPNSNSDKRVELISNLRAFRNKEYSASDMCVIFKRRDKYEFEYPKSYIKWIVMNLCGRTNDTNYADAELGRYVDLASFEEKFNEGYSCVSFPNAKNTDELTDAIVDYIIQLVNTGYEIKNGK